MPDERHHQDSDEDTLLNRLIRASREEADDGFIAPSPETITAYLRGTASKQQVEVVKAALTKSPAFRREILAMAQDMDVLAAAEPLPGQEKGEGPVVPDRPMFLERFEERMGYSPGYDTFWAKLKRWRVPQVYAPAAVVAAILVIMIVRVHLMGPVATPPSGLARWTMMEKRVDPGALIGQSTRGVAGGEPKESFPNPRDAALAEFRRILVYRDGAFRLNLIELTKRKPSEQASPLDQAAGLRTASLEFIDEHGGHLGDYRAEVPILDEETGRRPQAWLLTLPSIRLYMLDMISDTLAVGWTGDLEPEGCLTFTYRDKGGYRATKAAPFEFH
jgi:hypothetical protein